jgi:hypothetical protein
MAFAAAAVAGASTLQLVGAAFSAVSAISQMQAGRDQARAYQAQAKQETIKGKQAELQYRQQGIEVLRRTRQNLSTVTARAASGGLDPYSGSPQSLRNYAAATGTEEFYLAQENAQLAQITGDINAAQYRSAASQARRQGFMNAVGTLGSAAFTMGGIGGAPSNIGGVAGGGSLGGAVTNIAYPTAGSIGTPSML